MSELDDQVAMKMVKKTSILMTWFLVVEGADVGTKTVAFWVVARRFGSREK